MQRSRDTEVDWEIHDLNGKQARINKSNVKLNCHYIIVKKQGIFRSLLWQVLLLLYRAAES